MSDLPDELFLRWKSAWEELQKIEVSADEFRAKVQTVTDETAGEFRWRLKEIARASSAALERMISVERQLLEQLRASRSQLLQDTHERQTPLNAIVQRFMDTWSVERIAGMRQAETERRERQVVRSLLLQRAGLPDPDLEHRHQLDKAVGTFPSIESLAEEMSRMLPQELQQLPVDAHGHTMLWRPVGQAELDLIAASSWTRFPPRLDHQPFFYPVCTEIYARDISRKWNAPEGAGYVTRFSVRHEVASKYKVMVVGSTNDRELWVPASELPQFNDAIVGKIEVITTYRKGDAH